MVNKANTNQTAIIVDNDRNYRKTLSSLLKQHTQIREIYTCATGREAQAVCRQLKTVDFVFCDSEITDQPVLSLVVDMIKSKSAENAQIVLLSTQSRREFLLEAAAVGVNAFILKPFTPKTVSEKIQQLSGGKSQRRAKRIKIFQTITIHVAFKNAKYKGKLEDISTSGCMANLPALTEGGTIYDTAALRIVYEEEKVDLKAELIRLERDTGSDTQRVKAAFLYKNMDEETRQRFDHLWSSIDKSHNKPQNK